MKTAELIERAGIRRPFTWDDWGSSAKDLWEERQLTSLTKMLVEHPPRHHGREEVCLRAITTYDCLIGHEYNLGAASADEEKLMRWAWEHVS